MIFNTTKPHPALRWLARAAGAYLFVCAASWWAVPAAADWMFKKVPAYLPGFEAGAKDIRFNPFTLRATVEGLSLKQEKLGELASCQVLSAAFNPMALLRLALGLREMKLTI